MKCTAPPQRSRQALPASIMALELVDAHSIQLVERPCLDAAAQRLCCCPVCKQAPEVRAACYVLALILQLILQLICPLQHSESQTAAPAADLLEVILHIIFCTMWYRQDNRCSHCRKLKQDLEQQEDLGFSIPVAPMQIQHYQVRIRTQQQISIVCYANNQRPVLVSDLDLIGVLAVYVYVMWRLNCKPASAQCVSQLLKKIQETYPKGTRGQIDLKNLAQHDPLFSLLLVAFTVCRPTGAPGQPSPVLDITQLRSAVQNAAWWSYQKLLNSYEITQLTGETIHRLMYHGVGQQDTTTTAGAQLHQLITAYDAAQASPALRLAAPAGQVQQQQFVMHQPPQQAEPILPDYLCGEIPAPIPVLHGQVVAPFLQQHVSEQQLQGVTGARHQATAVQGWAQSPPAAAQHQMAVAPQLPTAITNGGSVVPQQQLQAAAEQVLPLAELQGPPQQLPWTAAQPDGAPHFAALLPPPPAASAVSASGTQPCADPRPVGMQSQQPLRQHACPVSMLQQTGAAAGADVSSVAIRHPEGLWSQEQPEVQGWQEGGSGMLGLMSSTTEEDMMSADAPAATVPSSQGAASTAAEAGSGVGPLQIMFSTKQQQVTDWLSYLQQLQRRVAASGKQGLNDVTQQLNELEGTIQGFVKHCAGYFISNPAMAATPTPTVAAEPAPAVAAEPAPAVAAAPAPAVAAASAPATVPTPFAQFVDQEQRSPPHWTDFISYRAQHGSLPHAQQLQVSAAESATFAANKDKVDKLTSVLASVGSALSSGDEQRQPGSGDNTTRSSSKHQHDTFEAEAIPPVAVAANLKLNAPMFNAPAAVGTNQNSSTSDIVELLTPRTAQLTLERNPGDQESVTSVGSTECGCDGWTTGDTASCRQVKVYHCGSCGVALRDEQGRPTPPTQHLEGCERRQKASQHQAGGLQVKVYHCGSCGVALRDEQGNPTPHDQHSDDCVRRLKASQHQAGGLQVKVYHYGSFDVALRDEQGNPTSPAQHLEGCVKTLKASQRQAVGA